MTEGSMTWNLERTWQVTIDDKTEELSTVELSRFRCVVMLGAAGAGKTTEAERLASHESALGKHVRPCRLAEFRRYVGGFERAASHALRRGERRYSPLPRCIRRGDDTGTPPLACDKVLDRDQAPRYRHRHPDYMSPGSFGQVSFSDVVREYAGHESFSTAFLQPLDDGDISVAAVSLGIDPEAFLEQLESTRARSLAGQPLALRMLMKLHQSECGLPSSLSELFEKGIERLVSDPQERHDIGTQSPIPTAAMIVAAEWLACYTMLSGREIVCFGEEPFAECTKRSRFRFEVYLGGPPCHRFLRDLRLHCPLRRSVLAIDSLLSFWEAVALPRLPAHQARALLASPDGWSNGIAGPLRETAAFAAMFNPDLAEWMSACDPDVIGLSDVADSNLRRKATLALLDRFRRKEMTDAQLWPGDVELRGLQYDAAAADLRSVIR